MSKLGLRIFVLLLAGCAQSGEDGAESSRAAGQPDVDWHAALAGDEIVVDLTDPEGYYRVERVELVGPGGRTYKAHDVARQTVRDRAGPYGGSAVGVGIGGGFGGGHGGVGIGLSFPLGGARPAPVVTRTTARIRLPDPRAYRRTFERWTIEVVLTDPAGATSYASIPAPGPTY